MRFGITMNDQNDCSSPDTSIGIGLQSFQSTDTASCAAGAHCGCCNYSGTCNQKCRTANVYVLADTCMQAVRTREVQQDCGIEYMPALCRRVLNCITVGSQQLLLMHLRNVFELHRPDRMLQVPSWHPQ